MQAIIAAVSLWVRWPRHVPSAASHSVPLHPLTPTFSHFSMMSLSLGEGIDVVVPFRAVHSRGAHSQLLDSLQVSGMNSEPQQREASLTEVEVQLTFYVHARD